MIEEEEKKEQKLAPLYISEFLLELEQLRFSPNLEDFHGGLHEVVNQFQAAVISVKNFTPDSYFDAFTRFISYMHSHLGSEI